MERFVGYVPDDFDSGPQCDEAVPMDCLENVPEMRPVDPYAEHALRDNYTREMAGLDDWQADFPASPDSDDDRMAECLCCGEEFHAPNGEEICPICDDCMWDNDPDVSELTEWMDFDSDC